MINIHGYFPYLKGASSVHRALHIFSAIESKTTQGWRVLILNGCTSSYVCDVDSVSLSASCCIRSYGCRLTYSLSLYVAESMYKASWPATVQTLTRENLSFSLLRQRAGSSGAETCGTQLVN